MTQSKWKRDFDSCDIDDKTKNDLETRALAARARMDKKLESLGYPPFHELNAARQKIAVLLMRMRQGAMTEKECVELKKLANWRE